MKTNTFSALWFLVILLQSLNVFAAESIEGYYQATVQRSCWSSHSGRCPVKNGLKIQMRNKSSYYLWLHTEGDFSHFCSYQDIASLENGVLVSRSTADDCEVSIKVVGKLASVESKGNGCANYCGANVQLDVSGLRKIGLTHHSSGTPNGAP